MGGVPAHGRGWHWVGFKVYSSPNHSVMSMISGTISQLPGDRQRNRDKTSNMTNRAHLCTTDCVVNGGSVSKTWRSFHPFRNGHVLNILLRTKEIKALFFCERAKIIRNIFSHKAHFHNKKTCKMFSLVSALFLVSLIFLSFKHMM